MMSFRDARKIQPRRELTVTGRRIAVVVVAQSMLVAGAFAAGYYLREAPVSRAAAAAIVSATDPLHALDSEDKRVDYTYEYMLTRPREKAELPPVREEAAAAAAVRSRAGAERADKLPRARASATPKVSIARAVAVRAPSEPEGEGGSDEVRALEARMQRIAQQSARTAVSAGGAARKPLREATTDDELLQAIGGKTARGDGQRADRSVSRQAGTRSPREEE